MRGEPGEVPGWKCVPLPLRRELRGALACVATECREGSLGWKQGPSQNLT